MENFSQTIEFLLLSRSEVMVPGLGVFTAHSYPAQWLEDEEIYLPPVRHVRFRHEVNADFDNVFTKAVAEINSCSMESAGKTVEKMIGDFHKELIINGSVDFGSIGLFTLEEDGDITMASYECGIATPNNYGFDALHVQLLANVPLVVEEEKIAETESESQETTGETELREAATETEQQGKDIEAEQIVVPQGAVETGDSKHIVIRLNRTLVHYTMVVAASILLFFLLSPRLMDEQPAEGSAQATTNYFIGQPTAQETASNDTSDESGKSTGNEGDNTDSTLDGFADEMTAESAEEIAGETTAKKAEEKAEEAAAEKAEGMISEVAETIAEEALTETAQDGIYRTLDGAYSIVLASAISQSNARHFISRLQKMELNAKIYDNGKMLRVVLDGFSTQSEAYNTNTRLHKQDKEFRSSWVMKN